VSERSPARRKLRVLTLIDRPITTGGGERMASTIAMGLDPTRFDRWLCSSRSAPAETFDDDLRAAGVKLLVLDRGSPAAVWAWSPLVQLLRRERIDVLHAHKFGSNVWGTIIGRLARVPVVIAHEHSWSYEGNPLRRFLDREVIGRGADAFVAVSREDEQRMISIEGVTPQKIRFVPNGIPPLATTGARAVRAELGISPDVPLAVWVGQMRPEKALDVLLDAIALAAPRVPGLQVVLVGHGPEEASARAHADAAGLRQVVHFLGRRNDVPDVLAESDIALLTSDREGSPLSVMEYMGSGLPVVATDVGGVGDLIVDGEHGLLAPARDPARIADALVDLCQDVERRRRLGAAALLRQQSEFSFAALVGRIEGLYEELFARTARAHAERWDSPPG
jgi:glycosyltransferase involved in cell wall biosynthesis